MASALGLVSLWFALKYWREGGGKAPFWAGVFAGLGLITKWEIALAAVAAGLVALIALEPVVAPSTLDGVASLSDSGCSDSAGRLCVPCIARVIEDAA